MSKRTEELVKVGMSSENTVAQQLALELNRVQTRLNFVTKKSMRRRSLLKRLSEVAELHKHRWKNDRMALNFYKAVYSEKEVSEVNKADKVLQWALSFVLGVISVGVVSALGLF